MNNFYRVGVTIHEGEFWKYQLYFTTWGLYLTLWAETWIIACSLFNKFKGIDLESSHQLRNWKHNSIAFQLALGSEIVIPIIYWAALYDYGDKITFRRFSGIIDHLVPTIIVLFEFFASGWTFRYKFMLIFFPFMAIYMPINATYAGVADEPLYDIMPWDNVGTYIVVFAVVVMLFGSMSLLTLFSKWRYNRWNSKMNQKDTSKVHDSKEEVRKANISENREGDSVEDET